MFHFDSDSRYSRRSAMTLVEVLVAIMIIGLLTALVLPAVQMSRESMRRTSCSNNLRQLALGIHNFESTFHSYPSGLNINTDSPTYSTWLAEILPFVELSAEATAMKKAYALEAFPFGSNVHEGFSKRIPLFICPSDPKSNHEWNSRTRGPVGMTNYLGNAGTNYPSHDGVLFVDSALRISRISDGTSNTLMIGERPPSPDGQYGWWYAGYGQDGSGSPDMVLGAREINIGDEGNEHCEFGPYRFQKGKPGNQCDIFHFWSFHFGGSNFAFCDGSVKLVPYSADNLLPSFATRAGGETIQN